MDSQKQCTRSAHKRRIITLKKINSKQWRASHLFPWVTTGLVTASPDHCSGIQAHCCFTHPQPSVESHFPLHLLWCYLGCTVAWIMSPKNKGRDWGKKMGKEERALVAKSPDTRCLVLTVRIISSHCQDLERKVCIFLDHRWRKNVKVTFF